MFQMRSTIFLEQQSEKIDELEAKLNEQIEKTAELKKSHDVLVRERVFNECRLLTLPIQR